MSHSQLSKRDYASVNALLFLEYCDNWPAFIAEEALFNTLKLDAEMLKKKVLFCTIVNVLINKFIIGRFFRDALHRAKLGEAYGYCAV